LFVVGEQSGARVRWDVEEREKERTGRGMRPRAEEDVIDVGMSVPSVVEGRSRFCLGELLVFVIFADDRVVHNLIPLCGRYMV
jgi:hypothetical protein